MKYTDVELLLLSLEEILNEKSTTTEEKITLLVELYGGERLPNLKTYLFIKHKNKIEQLLAQGSTPRELLPHFRHKISKSTLYRMNQKHLNRPNKKK